ncbi:MAG: FmdB family zinc ribbon protein, partial [Gemmatimonadales bacterium]
MPTYEYRCTRCRKRFSYQQSISEHGKRRPACP